MTPTHMRWKFWPSIPKAGPSGSEADPASLGNSKNSHLPSAPLVPSPMCSKVQGEAHLITATLWARCHDSPVPNRGGDQAQRAGVMGVSEHLLLLFVLPPLSSPPHAYPSLGLIPVQSHSRPLHPLGHCVPYICVPSQAVPVPCRPGLRPRKGATCMAPATHSPPQLSQQSQETQSLPPSHPAPQAPQC